MTRSGCATLVLGVSMMLAGAWAPTAHSQMTVTPSGMAAPATAGPETYSLFVLNQPKPGREQEFNHWYDQQHAQDVLINPTYEVGQRFIVNERQLHPDAPAMKAQYLMAFTMVTKDVGRTLQYIHDNLRSGKTVPTDTILSGPGMGGDLVYRAVTPERLAPATERQATRYLLIEFDDVQPGGEAAFGKWHDEVFSPKVAALRGGRGWQRFEFAAVQLTPTRPTIGGRYMTVYALDIPDAAAFDRLQHGFQTIDAAAGRRPGVTASFLTYRAIGPALKGPEVKQERASQ